MIALPLNAIAPTLASNKPTAMLLGATESGINCANGLFGSEVLFNVVLARVSHAAVSPRSVKEGRV